MSREDLLKQIDGAIARITAEELLAKRERPDLLEELENKHRKLDALQLRVEAEEHTTHSA